MGSTSMARRRGVSALFRPPHTSFRDCVVDLREMPLDPRVRHRPQYQKDQPQWGAFRFLCPSTCRNNCVVQERLRGSLSRLAKNTTYVIDTASRATAWRPQWALTLLPCFRMLSGEISTSINFPLHLSPRTAQSLCSTRIDLNCEGRPNPSHL